MKQEKIFTLLNEMSLDEKIGQLIQLSGEFFSASDISIGPIEKLGISKKMVNLCGSALNVVIKYKINKCRSSHITYRCFLCRMLFMVLKLSFQFLWD